MTANFHHNARVHFPFVDFAKGFAMVSIVIYHFLLPLDFGFWINNAVSFGGSGIHLFFVLSGFGLGFSQISSVKGFLIRRFSKVVIPYYIFVTFTFLLNLLIPFYPDAGWKEWLSHIFLYKMFVEEYTGSFGFQLWFMSAIIQLYLVFPLIVKFFDRFGTLPLLLVSVILSAGYLFLIVDRNLEYHRIWNSFFLTFLWEFVLGFLIAGNINIFYRIHFYIWQYITITIAGLGFMALMMTGFGQTGRIFNDIFGLLAFASFAMVIYRLSDTNFFSWTKPVLLRIGKISFELYLVHYLVFSSFNYYLQKSGGHYSLYHVPVLLIVALLTARGFQGLMRKVHYGKLFKTSG